jgi:hypothetical protein
LIIEYQRRYVIKISSYWRYRINLDTPTDSTSSINITKQLGSQNSPDKVSKVDVSIENDYSLPPVVLSTPREPVRLINGRFLLVDYN